MARMQRLAIPRLQAHTQLQLTKRAIQPRATHRLGHTPIATILRSNPTSRMQQLHRDPLRQQLQPRPRLQQPRVQQQRPTPQLLLLLLPLRLQSPKQHQFRSRRRDLMRRPRRSCIRRASRVNLWEREVHRGVSGSSRRIGACSQKNVSSLLIRSMTPIADKCGPQCEL